MTNHPNRGRTGDTPPTRKEKTQPVYRSDQRLSYSGWANLTTEQINIALKRAGMITAAQAHGNVYNDIRRGDLHAAVGTLRSGDDTRMHKTKRNMLRRHLRPFLKVEVLND